MESTNYMLYLVNYERERAGIEPLILDSCLNRVARQQSDYQASTNQLTHDNPAGNISQRGFSAGFHGSHFGENVGWNYNDEISAIRG